MDNLSLFNDCEESSLATVSPYAAGALDVVKLEFVEAETIGWQAVGCFY